MNAQWTWLVYMAGDNNLQDAGKADLVEMKAIGSTPDVNVIVQFDTEQQITTRLRVDKGRIKTLQTLPGVDCGDPKVLSDFIKWGAKNFPAERYAVIVWNHGGGWEDADIDYDANRAAKPRDAARRVRARRTIFRTTHKRIAKLPHSQRMIAIDCGSQDYLDNQELRRAFETANVKVDLLGCDACLMNMFEIAYEMRGTAKCMVGSEEAEPGAGWPYADILEALTKTPTMPTEDLASTIVKKYAAWYQVHGSKRYDKYATQSAFALGKVSALADAVDLLATTLTADMKSSKNIIALASQGALAFDEPSYIDLGDFAARVKNGAPAGGTVAKAAQGVLDALNVTASGFVLANGTWGDHVKDAKGVSIFFPTRTQRGELSTLFTAYDKLHFATEHRPWRAMLESYFNAIS